ncbi:MAG: restriction endonuclease subunit S [Melioribacteraceae bacterium]|nr:restriction endonuclease subunit S [Melioribacteraceae bacterium]MCF8353905.1 restriction endonuclease subunit S [Melioribacteraceae bacterium]MCF8392662.1 restriction endonuclease subunit S [Melioribacteraceae bacterium]MCF8417683.1 restriction endonuclease subunit S [Melioribacteraceae bacterium]
MSNSIVKIGSYIAYQKGKAPSETFDSYKEGLKPYLSPEYLRGISQPIYVSPNGRLVEVDDDEVIVLWDGSNAGEIFISKSGVLASTMTKLIIDEDQFHKRYFIYSMKYLEYILKAKTAGSGIPHVDKGILKNLAIFKPELPEQKAIAKILSTVDELIQATKETITKAERLKKSLMQNLLTGKLKPDGTWHAKDELCEDRKLGLLPKTWKVLKIKDAATRVTDGEHVTPPRSAKGYYLLSARNIKNSALQLDDVDYVDEDTLKKIYKRIKPEKDDLLVSCSGTIGNVCLVPDNFDFAMVRSVAIIQYEKQFINPIYFEMLFQSPIIQKQIKVELSSAVQSNLFQNSIKKITIPLPPRSEQNVIAAKIKPLSGLVNQKNEKIKNLEKLKKSLMQNLLTGEKRIDLNKFQKFLKEEE